MVHGDLCRRDFANNVSKVTPKLLQKIHGVVLSNTTIQDRADQAYSAKTHKKAACLALEAITGILLGNSLKDPIVIEGCHSINDSSLGYRPFGGLPFQSGSTVTSFNRESNLPLVVHTNYRNIAEDYGNNHCNIVTLKQIIDAGDAGILHGRCCNIILKAFSKVTDKSRIDELYKLMQETSGSDKAFEICQEEDAKTSAREVWVSVTGKFGDNGGVKHKDYFVYTTLTGALSKRSVGRAKRILGENSPTNAHIDKARKIAEEGRNIFVGLFFPCENGKIKGFGNGVLVKHSGLTHTRS
jgi:hypothetical protein